MVVGKVTFRSVSRKRKEAGKFLFANYELKAFVGAMSIHLRFCLSASMATTMAVTNLQYQLRKRFVGNHVSDVSPLPNAYQPKNPNRSI